MSMRMEFERTLRVRTATVLAMAVALAVAAVAPVEAIDLSGKGSKFRLNLDTTLSWGGLYRMEDRDPAIISPFEGGTAWSVNGDDGNLNFDKGIVSNTVKATIDLDFSVEQGRGYRPAEGRGRMTIGELPVDAVFSPVKRVSYKIENTREGQILDYDKLIMEIWTDGTVAPEDALSTSAKYLIDQVGNLRLTYAFGTPIDDMLQDVRYLLKQAGS